MVGEEKEIALEEEDADKKGSSDQEITPEQIVKMDAERDKDKQEIAHDEAKEEDKAREEIKEIQDRLAGKKGERLIKEIEKMKKEKVDIGEILRECGKIDSKELQKTIKETEKEIEITIEELARKSRRVKDIVGKVRVAAVVTAIFVGLGVVAGPGVAITTATLAVGALVINSVFDAAFPSPFR